MSKTEPQCGGCVWAQEAQCARPLRPPNVGYTVSYQGTRVSIRQLAHLREIECTGDINRYLSIRAASTRTCEAFPIIICIKHVENHHADAADNAIESAT